MKKLLTFLLLCVCSAARAQYTDTQLSDITRTNLPSTGAGAIKATNVVNVFDAFRVSFHNILDSGITGIEFSYLNGLTGPVQPQIDSKQFLSEKGIANGYAGLDANGKVAKASVPNPVAVTGTGTLAVGVYTIASPDPPYTSTANYPNGFGVLMATLSPSLGSESLKVGNGPTKLIVLPNGNNVPSGDISTNGLASLVFSAGLDRFVLNNPASAASFSSAFLIGTNAPSTITVDLAGNGVALTNLPAIPQGLLYGRSSAGVGNTQLLGIGTGLALSGTNLTATATGSVVANLKRILCPIAEDWIGGTVGGSIIWTGSAMNAGTGAGVGGAAGHPGVFNLQTQGATNGGFAVGIRSDAIALDSHDTIHFKLWFQLPAISTDTDDYKIFVGLGDSVNQIDNDVDRIGVTYHHTVADNSGKWRLVTREASAETITEGSTVPNFGTGTNGWNVIEIDGTITSITASANGVAIGTATANIPDGANKLGILFKIQGTNPGSAANSEILALDACSFYIDRDIDR